MHCTLMSCQMAAYRGFYFVYRAYERPWVFKEVVKVENRRGQKFGISACMTVKKEQDI